MMRQDFQASYRRQLALNGQDVIVRRYSGKGAGRDVLAAATLKAHVAQYQPAELVGSIVQGDRRVILMAADLGALGALNKHTDILVISGVETAIEAIDVDTRQVAGAIELQVRG